MADQVAPVAEDKLDYEGGGLSTETNWWGAFVIGLAGTILVTGIAPVMVTSLGAASIPLIEPALQSGERHLAVAIVGGSPRAARAGPYVTRTRACAHERHAGVVYLSACWPTSLPLTRGSSFRPWTA